MIADEEIREIVKTYEKHGWTLQRVLFSASFAENRDIFPDDEIEKSDFDAMWFSRSSKAGSTAWELRHLSPTPLAFLTVINDAEGDADARIADTENRLREALVRKQSSETASLLTSVRMG